MRQIAFELPFLDLHADRSVITRIFKRAEKLCPVDIPAPWQLRTMKLQRVGQDAYLVQPLPIDGYVLKMNAEDARRKFLERGDMVHLLPDLVRGIVIESEIRAGDLLEHAPPDRRTGGKILPSGPF